MGTDAGMTLITDIKEGMTLRMDDRLYRVLEVIRHAGSGQMHGFVELKLRDLQFGHFADRRFKLSDRVELVDLTRRQMDFLYADNEACYFMDPQSYEQVALPKQSMGKMERLLKEGSRIIVELHGESAVAVEFPKIVEMIIASTGPGIRDGQDNTMKPALLENGVEILVPQFIETGDHVRVDTERMKYVDRIVSRRA
jgi:elongation factor P